MNSISNNFSTFGLSESNLSRLDERTFVVTKWNWDYVSAWDFQRHALNWVQEHPRMRLLICCSHPRVLTHGRGLQRPRKGQELGLKEFKAEEFETLPYPFHQIERGGGLTFHHPGQFIFYPVLKLNPSALSLSKMTNDIFDFAIDVLSDWGLKRLDHSKKLLGLWQGERKLASMGIAIEKLTTFHGMALNLNRDEEMTKALAVMNPCGLASTTYVAVDELIPLPPQALERFTVEFLKRVAHGWK